MVDFIVSNTLKKTDSPSSTSSEFPIAVGVGIAWFELAQVLGIFFQPLCSTLLFLKVIVFLESTTTSGSYASSALSSARVSEGPCKDIDR